MTETTSPHVAQRVARRHFEIMAEGRLDEFAQEVHPEAVNREAKDEPPECRGRGPAAFLATAEWLRPFADLRWDVGDVVAEDDLIAAHTTMSGRQVGPFVTYDEAGRVERAFSPNGKRMTTTQTHWLRVADDGKLIEHWANRDDMGMATQLGWIPPSPAYLVRCAVATRRAKRDQVRP